LYDSSVNVDTYIAEEEYAEQERPSSTSGPIDTALLICHYIAAVDQQLSALVARLEEVNHLTQKLDESNRKLETLALTDALTGVANRRLADDRLSLKLAEAERGEPLAVFLIDVDDFKAYNDKHGHAEGDHALRLIAQALSANLRKVDCLARYGGEEFIVISQVGQDDLCLVANKLLAAVRQINETVVPVSVSIGAASYFDGDTAELLVYRADMAMYTAKANGKIRACVDSIRQ
jgi:diguanylate cyclase (GGDEF)-like protein